MKKIYTGKSLDELKALAISEIKELGVDEADIKTDRRRPERR